MNDETTLELPTLAIDNIPDESRVRFIVCPTPAGDDVPVSHVLRGEDPDNAMRVALGRITYHMKSNAAAVVAAAHLGGMTEYLGGFLPYQPDDEWEVESFNEDVLRSLKRSLHQDDPFRVAVIIAHDMQVSADRHIVDLAEEMVTAVKREMERDGVLEAAAESLRDDMASRSGMLKGLIERWTAGRTAPAPGP